MLAGAIDNFKAIPERWIKALMPTRCLKDLLSEEATDIGALERELAKGLLIQGKQFPIKKQRPLEFASNGLCLTILASMISDDLH